MARATLRRRALSHLLLLAALALFLQLRGPRSFIGVPPSAPQSTSKAGLSKLHATAAETQPPAAQDELKKPVMEEMDDFEKFIDRWNTRGGIILASVFGTAAVIGTEKLLELIPGLDYQKAGVATTVIGSVILFWWTGTYLFRVANKQTTYAQQLADYEQAVMTRRIAELSEEEIEALCEEVGIELNEIDDMLVEGNYEGETRRDKLVNLFATTQASVGLDTRNML
mmetsp:Transcript_59171/g.105163  ORF Transcript_59171/g.105163 Transcript_59171/m.105163 type:complete len:226 (-) Transcript_59171:46-723(-)